MFKLTRAPGSGKRVFMKPKVLPCGCEVIGHAAVIGLDGQPVQGVAGINTETGWIWIRKWAVYPELTRVIDGKLASTKEGMQLMNTTAPFELRCINHGRIG